MNAASDSFKDYGTQLPVEPPPRSHIISTFRDVGLVIGAILLLTLLAAGVIYLLRRKQHRRKRTGRELETAPRSHRRRRRKRHSQHANPSLAESGGLPPKRASDSQSLAPLI